ncbi:g4168 [Coccomyxa viridis]|uniref:G4168 protein n=1 Tax=Coccomyxa viridis TaxID=1274662 RepID=A0ABP1FSF8_9CHLO
MAISAGHSAAFSCRHTCTEQRSLSLGCQRQAFRGGAQATRQRLVHTAAESGAALKKPEVATKETAPESTGQQSNHSASSAPAKSGPTIREQRDAAKAMSQYFKDFSAAKTAEKRQVFGWTRANEILNGRWVMFGVFVGLLTEYSTGVDFINQLKLMVSYLGIADIYD